MTAKQFYEQNKGRSFKKHDRWVWYSVGKLIGISGEYLRFVWKCHVILVKYTDSCEFREFKY